jgi:hypothetical protein
VEEAAEEGSVVAMVQVEEVDNGVMVEALKHMPRKIAAPVMHTVIKKEEVQVRNLLIGRIFY